jgi:hypothetical protein
MLLNNTPTNNPPFRCKNNSKSLHEYSQKRKREKMFECDIVLEILDYQNETLSTIILLKCEAVDE